MKDTNQMIKDVREIAEETQQELTAYLDGKGNPNRREAIEGDKFAKSLEQASINAQLTATHLGKLLED